MYVVSWGSILHTFTFWEVNMKNYLTLGYVYTQKHTTALLYKTLSLFQSNQKTYLDILKENQFKDA